MRIRDRGRRLCAIVTAEIAGRDAEEIVHRLRASGINTSAATAEDGSSMVRVSPHYYNTREEVDTLVDAIEALLQEQQR